MPPVLPLPAGTHGSGGRGSSGSAARAVPTPTPRERYEEIRRAAFADKTAEDV